MVAAWAWVMGTKRTDVESMTLADSREGWLFDGELLELILGDDQVCQNFLGFPSGSQQLTVSKWLLQRFGCGANR